MALSFAPNLRRDRVSYEGRLDQPLRFREAVSALHDVVVSDLRYQPKDKSAYQAYLAERRKQEEALRRQATTAAEKTTVAISPNKPVRRSDVPISEPPFLNNTLRTL